MNASFPKKLALFFILSCAVSLYAEVSHAQGDGVGQIIQINTRFRSFVGRPSWLLIIRDLDHDQNIPYVFDVNRGQNTWTAVTYSHNYLISVSNLQFSPYHNYPNRMYPYTSAKINNFCHLESNGHIYRNESIYVTLSGNLTPNTNTYTCHVSRHKEPNFVVVSPQQ